jgi:hypothetical protein
MSSSSIDKSEYAILNSSRKNQILIRSLHSVIKLIIQFLRENNLNQSRCTLEKESNQSLNTVENKSKFIQDILDGRWDVILKQVNQLSIPNEKLFDLYEQVLTVST